MNDDYAATLMLLAGSVEECQKNSLLPEAYATLQADKPESAELLSLKAAEMLEKVRESNPENPYVQHHLAIIHHGTGYQMHLQDRASDKQTIEHWRRGIQIWARVIEDDAFWNSLRDRWRIIMEEGKHDMLVERLMNVDLKMFRQQLPGHILTLHANIVQDAYRSDVPTAAAHVKLILESGFAQKEIERLRRKIYSNLAGDVTVLCNEMKYDEARTLISRYLEIDPDNVRAHCDYLRVCSAECDLAGRGGENIEQRIKALRNSESHAQHLSVVKAAESDVLVADILRDYYYSQADLLRDQAQKTPGDNTPEKVRLFDKAHGMAKKAVNYERVGQKARQLFIDICYEGARTDTNCTGSNLKTARKLLDSGLGLFDREPAFHAANAAYYLCKGEHDSFRAELRRAEQFNEAVNDQRATALIVNLKEYAQQDSTTNRCSRLMKDAIEAMNAHRFGDALRYLGQAAELEEHLSNDDMILVYWASAFCHLSSGNLIEATACYRRAKARLRHDSNSDLRQHMNELGKILDR